MRIGRDEAIGIAYRARFAPAGDESAAPAAGANGRPGDMGGPSGGDRGTAGYTAGAAARALAQLERQGHVQIDTISVVERAHHHALWSGDRSYRPAVLPLLESEPRRAFEYWAHAAAYLPMGDYRYCLPRMRRIAESGHEWFPTDPTIVGAVLDRIRAEGPLRSCDFGSEAGPRGPWWDWKPAKAALEFLFMSGRLLVASRPGFQKLYDLAERVLPDGLDTSLPSEEEMGDWYVRRAALAYGVFAEQDLAYQRKDCRGGLRAALARAAEAGRLIEVAVEGDEKKPAWVAAAALESASGGRPAAAGRGLDPRPARILSPFDGYIIDRRRSRRLLGFDYTLECYVPEAKRRFGYFALPVLWNGRPVGLLDCAADRKAGILVVKRWELPKDYPEGFPEAFRVELEAFSAFNGCSAIDARGGPAAGLI